MSDKNLLRRPHHQKRQEHWWWYEEPSGIAVVVDVSKLDAQHKPVLEIPWRSIRAAIQRKDK